MQINAPIYSRRLLLTSLFISVDCVYAYLLGNCMDFAIWDGLCVISSINYWRNPQKDWRRTCDMIISVPLFMYHVLVAYVELLHYSQPKYLYLLMAAACMVLYFMGSFSKEPRIGQILHSTMHILGVCACLLMYYYVSKERKIG